MNLEEIKGALYRARRLLEIPPSLDCISWKDKRGIQHNEFHRETYLMSQENWIKAILQQLEIVEEFFGVTHKE